MMSSVPFSLQRLLNVKLQLRRQQEQRVAVSQRRLTDANARLDQLRDELAAIADSMATTLHASSTGGEFLARHQAAEGIQKSISAGEAAANEAREQYEQAVTDLKQANLDVEQLELLREAEAAQQHERRSAAELKEADTRALADWQRSRRIQRRLR